MLEKITTGITKTILDTFITRFILSTSLPFLLILDFSIVYSRLQLGHFISLSDGSTSSTLLQFGHFFSISFILPPLLFDFIIAD